jgi:hypothetical protein
MIRNIKVRRQYYCSLVYTTLPLADPKRLYDIECVPFALKRDKSYAASLLSLNAP